MSEIKCRAAILYKEGDPLVIEETIVAAPQPDQVRVKMVSAGICASDAHYAWGMQKAADLGMKLPLVLGHEGAGIVESVGANVDAQHLKPGDHVLTTFLPQCKQCDWCRNPSTNLCKHNLFPTLGSRVLKRLAKNQEPVYGFAGLGVYSEYVTLDRAQVVKIDPKANLANSVVISCAVGTGFYSATNLAQVTAGSTCAVWGIGAIGLSALQGCQFNGAKHILAVDLNPAKRDLAMRFGATEFVNPKDLPEPLEKWLLERYGGVDFAFDCFGSQGIIDVALKSLSPFGKFTMVGITKPEVMIQYPALELISGRAICGGSLGGKKSDQACEELVRLYMDKKVMIDELITQRFKLDEINEAFRMLREGKCIRSLIVF